MEGENSGGVGEKRRLPASPKGKGKGRRKKGEMEEEGEGGRKGIFAAGRAIDGEKKKRQIWGRGTTGKFFGWEG